jgi:hypothetical protein
MSKGRQGAVLSLGIWRHASKMCSCYFGEHKRKEELGTRQLLLCVLIDWLWCKLGTRQLLLCVLIDSLRGKLGTRQLLLCVLIDSLWRKLGTRQLLLCVLIDWLWRHCYLPVRSQQTWLCEGPSVRTANLIHIRQGPRHYSLWGRGYGAARIFTRKFTEEMSLVVLINTVYSRI